MFSKAFGNIFTMEANPMNPDQTTPREQSDLGPYCLQYRLSKVCKQIREQMTIVLNGGKRVYRYFLSMLV